MSEAITAENIEQIISAQGRRRDASVRHQLEQARKVMTQSVKNSEV